MEIKNVTDMIYKILFKRVNGTQMHS